MSTSIQTEKKKPAAPVITILGNIYNQSANTVTYNVETVMPAWTDIATLGATPLRVRRAQIYIFAGPIEVTITPDPDYPTTTYTMHSSTANIDFVGARNMKYSGPTSRQVATLSETWYTWNGKNPVQTRARLYYNESFWITENKSGSDNTVLKVKTYYNGVASDIAQAQFRIVNGPTPEPVPDVS